MKKIRNLILTLMLMFVGIVGINAATLNIEDVSRKFDELIQEYDFLETTITSKVNTTDKHLDIYSDEEKIFSMIYGEDYIEYSNRSVEITKENCMDGVLDYIWIGNVINSVFELSGYTDKTLKEDVDYTNTYDIYGIQLESEKFDFSESDGNGNSSSMSGDFVRYVKISLDTEKIDALMARYGTDIEEDLDKTENEEIKNPEKSWDGFVEYFKNSKRLNGFEDVTIVSDDKNLIITIVSDEKTYETKYTYENGIVTYSKKGDKFFDYTLNEIVINYLSDAFKYNYYKLYSYIFDSEGLTIDKDGIEYTLEDMYTKEEMDAIVEEWNKYYESLTEEEKEEMQGVGFANELIFTNLKVDIKNGLKTYDESKIAWYQIIEGKDQKYEVGKTESLTVRADADFELFEAVYVDGKLVDKSNYEAKSGSTIVILKKEYLDKLSSGEHTIKMTFKDGEFAETKFNVEVKNVSTGVNLGIGILTLIVIISGIVYFLIRKQSRFPKYN